MVNREVGSKSPRSPLSPFAKFGSGTPPVSPAGFLVFGQFPATVLGSYHPKCSGLGIGARQPSCLVGVADLLVRRKLLLKDPQRC